jgi:hypothetical protein
MGRIERIVNTFLVGILFSVVSWLVVKNLIVEMSFIKYFIIEIFIVGMLKLSTYVNQKLGL